MEKIFLQQQKNEITEHHVYARLAKLCKEKKNKKILENISQDELKHYGVWEKITKKKVKPSKFKISWYVFLAKIFGLSFSLKLMEGGEEDAQEFYRKYTPKYPQLNEIRKDEEKHENDLINLLNDNRLNYASAIVLGLNDALVELTGTLAGLTLAFANSTIIGVTGLIMGIAASMSMAASGYLSSREGESDEQNPIISAIYTGVAYIITVMFLVVPYFMLESVFAALGVMLAITVLIIFAYTFYISVAKELSFKRRFLEMALISLGVAVISFGIGYVVKVFFGIEV